MAEKQHVFLVGAKSLGAYGGYETFIDKLTEYHQDNKNIQYHVAVKANGQGHMDETKVDAKIISGSRFIYHNADCFKIHVPEKLGPAQAIYYDCKALDKCVEIIKEELPFLNYNISSFHQESSNPPLYHYSKALYSHIHHLVLSGLQYYFHLQILNYLLMVYILYIEKE